METAVCVRCKRTRLLKYLVPHKYKKGKMRCRARSVCSSIARRRKESNGIFHPLSRQHRLGGYLPGNSSSS